MIKELNLSFPALEKKISIWGKKKKQPLFMYLNFILALRAAEAQLLQKQWPPWCPDDNLVSKSDFYLQDSWKAQSNTNITEVSEKCQRLKASQNTALSKGNGLVFKIIP